MQKDPYDVLGVSRDAPDGEIEEAYREKAKEYHPDVCDREDATEMFKQVKQAYELALSEEVSGEDETEDRERDTTVRGGGGKDSDETEERVTESYGDGWHLARGDGGWFVFTKTETAPHVDGTVRMYLDGDGGMSSDRFYFETEQDARAAYNREYGEASGDDGTAHRQNRRETEEDSRGTGSFEDEGVIWGGTRKAGYLDSLWRLCYQEGRTRSDGRKARRWGVTTDVRGDDRYINADGEYQGSEFWFSTEEDARDGYESYIREMKRSRKGGGTGRESTERSSGRTGSGGEYARRHPVVQVAIEGVASIPDRFPAFLPHVRTVVDTVTKHARNPVISFLHYVTFPRLAAFTKASLKALVIGYAFVIFDTAWGPDLLVSIFGEGFVETLTSGMFPLVVYFAVVVLLFALLLED
jgi:hypothetical protein